MSAALAFHSSSLTATRLVGTIVWTLLWCSFALGFSQVASAGCDYGHAKQSQFARHATDPLGYARQFRMLGQWVYEGGQIQYVARRAESPCHGPNCSANREPREDAGMSLPQLHRTHPSAAHLQPAARLSHPGLIEAMPLEDAKAAPGYPPAYEYPP